MTIESGDLARRLAVDPTYLWRWRRAGWITPAVVRPTRSGGALWPDWCLRMGALLRSELTAPGPGCSLVRRDILTQVAQTLEMFPDTDYVVIHNGIGLPADARMVVALHERHRTGPCTTAVAVPALAAIP